MSQIEIKHVVSGKIVVLSLVDPTTLLTSFSLLPTTTLSASQAMFTASSYSSFQSTANALLLLSYLFTQNIHKAVIQKRKTLQLWQYDLVAFL